MNCQCRFINYNKCITPLGNVDNEGEYAFVGQGLCRESQYFPPQFCCEPKTSMENSLNF